MTSYDFPPGFLWGAATAAYQIEGACNADGKGESIWDRFSHTPGKIAGGDTGDVACDHYHRYRDDIVLMQQLGLKAYRFSTAWPRVLPSGRGRPNPAGLAFYDRLVDGLLAAGIEPFVTLYHWDLPQALQDSGGWLNRDTGPAFADYATLMVKLLGDRVRHWTTLNEPGVVAFDGYLSGEHAPGIRDLPSAMQVVHNLLVAHGLATQAMRAAEPGIRAGIVLNLWGADPASDDPADVAAADLAWSQSETLFLEPVLRGHYHPAIWDTSGAERVVILPGDMALIAQKPDFLGINYYSRNLVSAAGPIEPVPGADYTDMGWEVCAPGLRRVLERIHRDYRLPPLYITENGAAFPDVVDADGRVRDERRLAYLRDHFIATHEAMQNGVDVRGYFVWSLFDNFEWAHGYKMRFGIVRVDYETQQRTIKDSGAWYADVIRNNRVRA